MKAKLNLSAVVSRLCVAVLAFLGYSCDNNGGDMYGTPTGTWEIKGEVTDQEATPVKNATIKLTIPSYNSSEFSFIEAQTNDGGEYYTSYRGPLEKELKVVCIPDDPALEADSTIVDLKYSGSNKKDEWYFGTAKATADFKLKKKED